MPGLEMDCGPEAAMTGCDQRHSGLGRYVGPKTVMTLTPSVIPAQAGIHHKSTGERQAESPSGFPAEDTRH